jgi:hypothetical protein
MENFEIESVDEAKELTLEDIQQKSFVSLKEGETVELTVKKLRKVRVPAGDKYKLSGQDYKFEILTTKDQILNIIAWDLWGKVRKIMQDEKKINGITLKISHPSKGEYLVEKVA